MGKRPATTSATPATNGNASKPVGQNQRSELGDRNSVIKERVDARYGSALEEDDPFAGVDWTPAATDDEAATGEPPHVTTHAMKESTADYEVPASPTRVTLPEPQIDRTPPGPINVQPQVEATSLKKSNGNGHGGGNGNGRYTLSRLAKVMISRSGDGDTDAQRVGEAHQLMRSVPGPDRFCFIVMARGGALQLDFPNDSTTITDELIDQLKMLPGVESVQVSMNL